MLNHFKSVNTYSIRHEPYYTSTYIHFTHQWFDPTKSVDYNRLVEKNWTGHDWAVVNCRGEYIFGTDQQVAMNKKETVQTLLENQH